VAEQKTIVNGTVGALIGILVVAALMGGIFSLCADA
jgi:hypothetical protein